MNIFGFIGHFFASLFGKHGDEAQKVLHEAGSFVQLAVPIVQEVESGIKALPDQGKSVQAIEGFLAKYIPDMAQAGPIALSLSSLPPATLWHNLAVTALQAIAPKGTAGSLLNLAVEFAYNIFKQSKASPITAVA